MSPAPVHCVKDKYITKISGKIIKLYKQDRRQGKKGRKATSPKVRFNLFCFMISWYPFPGHR